MAEATGSVVDREGVTLLVFAHRDEAAAFQDVPHLVTGVGKINAAGALAQALAEGLLAASKAACSGALAAVGARKDAQIHSSIDVTQRVDRVIVLGTAGLISDEPDAPKLDTVCQVTGALQHDFSLPSPELELAGEIVLPNSSVKIATGDVFVQNDDQRTAIAGLGATLVDMESYAFASVCERFDVPLQLFKVPSDFADSSTTDEEWDEIVLRKSQQLRDFWDAHFATE